MFQDLYFCIIYQQVGRTNLFYERYILYPFRRLLKTAEILLPLDQMTSPYITSKTWAPQDFNNHSINHCNISVIWKQAIKTHVPKPIEPANLGTSYRLILCHLLLKSYDGQTRSNFAAKLLHATLLRNLRIAQCVTMTCKGCTASVARQDCVAKLQRVCPPLESSETCA